VVAWAAVVLAAAVVFAAAAVVAAAVVWAGLAVLSPQAEISRVEISIPTSKKPKFLSFSMTPPYSNRSFKIM
jgi:hypothetical protein